jgi:long-chain acyl-CoA synthetase
MTGSGNVTHVAECRILTIDDWALDDDVGRLSWVEQNDRANRLINGLRRFGLQHGDTVAIVGGNRREWIEAVGAAAGDGKQWVPVNWHFSPDEIAYVLENSGADLVIADAEYGDKVAEAASHAGVAHRVADGGGIDGFLSYDDMLASSSAGEPDGQVAGDVMIYTSGTTGRPRGVVSNSSDIGADLEAANAPTEMFMQLLGVPTEGGTVYNSAPLHHGGPLVFPLVPHSLGSRLVLRREAGRRRRTPTHRRVPGDHRARSAHPLRWGSRSPRPRFTSSTMTATNSARTRPAASTSAA